MVNAKTPYTLQQLSSTFLKSMMANPEVPPSMKEKLKATLDLKGGRVCMSDKAYKDEHKRLIHALDTQDPKLLKAELKEQTDEVKLRGGLAGVSKASGFVQRMMAENKLKHKGQYKKPTAPPADNSSMSKWVAFDYKKLANNKQGGEGEAKYGASPFIQKYFKDKARKFESGNTAPESDGQKDARSRFGKKSLAPVAPEEEEEEEPPKREVPSEESPKVRTATRVPGEARWAEPKQLKLPAFSSPTYAYRRVEAAASKIAREANEAGRTRAELTAQTNTAKRSGMTLKELQHQMALNMAFPIIAKEMGIPVNTLRERYDDGQIEDYEARGLFGEGRPRMCGV